LVKFEYRRTQERGQRVLSKYIFIKLRGNSIADKKKTSKWMDGFGVRLVRKFHRLPRKTVRLKKLPGTLLDQRGETSLFTTTHIYYTAAVANTSNAKLFFFLPGDISRSPPPPPPPPTKIKQI